MGLAHSDVLERRARFMKVEQEAPPGEASEGIWTEQEPAEAPKGFATLSEEVEDDQQGLNPESKSSDEVLAGELLRTEAKFSARAVAEASRRSWSRKTTTTRPTSQLTRRGSVTG